MKVGEIKETRQVARWHDCEKCGNPAQFRLTFLLDNCRSNPGSSAYRHDDCSWCSDLELFLCRKCKGNSERSHAPHGYGWCACFPLKNFKHMGFYWVKVA